MRSASSLSRVLSTGRHFSPHLIKHKVHLTRSSGWHSSVGHNGLGCVMMSVLCLYFRRSHHDVAIFLPWFQSVSSEGQPEQPKDVCPVAVPHAENQTLSDRTCEFLHPRSTTPTALGSPDTLCLPACRWMTKGRCSSVWTTATHASQTWSSWWSFTSSTVGCCPANSNTTAPGSPCEPRAPRDPSLDEHSLCICALNNTNRQNNATAWLKPLLR